MASSDNTASMAAFPHRLDPVVRAQARMRLAITDSSYETARTSFFRSRPTSCAGALAKLEAADELLRCVVEGDELTAAGAREVQALLRDVAKHLRSNLS